MRSVTILILALILNSCDNPVRFEVPQPEGRRNEQSIPKKLTGHYSSLSDSSNLTISDRLILKRKVSNQSIPLSSLDSAERANIQRGTHDTTQEIGLQIKMTIKGVTVFQHIEYRDTLFSSSRGDLLRKFKGYYFINQQTSKSRWSVTKIAKVKGGLTLGNVSSVDDIKNLRELTGVLSDTTNTFHPTRKQLRAFLKAQGFSNEEIFIKLN